MKWIKLILLVPLVVGGSLALMFLSYLIVPILIVATALFILNIFYEVNKAMKDDRD